MLDILFAIALIYVAIRMLVWGLKATWNIAKIIAFAVLLPTLIIGLAVSGLIMLAIVLLVLSVILASVGALVWA